MPTLYPVSPLIKICPPLAARPVTSSRHKACESIMQTRVEDVMTDPFPILREDTPVELASLPLQMEEAILVSRKGSIVGILTSADFLKLGLKR